MPNARASRRPHVALALSLASALFVATALALPRETVRAASNAAAAACPAEPPTPLRTLYHTSERIAAARAGESVAVEGQQHMRRTAFVATESIKGDPGEKSFFVYHPVWPEDADYAGNFRKGETLLLFLHRAEDVEKEGYYVTDIRHGAKRLSEADLKIYFKRIEELQWITRQEPPNRAELLEWLVRCVDEPATRWEGAYELAVSQQLAAAEAEAEREKARAADAEAADAKTETGGEESEGEDVDAGEQFAEASGESDAEAQQADAAVTSEAAEVLPVGAADSTGIYITSPEVGIINGADVDAKLVNQLTGEQKERLAGVLYGAEKMGEGEIQLVYVVENWDGARLAPFIVRHLQKIQNDPPYDAERLMHVLARVLKDERLVRLAEKYMENAPYDDDSVEAEEEEASTESADADATDAEVSEEEAEAVDEQQHDSGEVEEIMAGALVTQAGGVRPKASQVRGRMLHNFLAAVEKRMNDAGAETAQR